jgi:hypothetical protein
VMQVVPGIRELVGELVSKPRPLREGGYRELLPDFSWRGQFS